MRRPTPSRRSAVLVAVLALAALTATSAYAHGRDDNGGTRGDRHGKRHDDGIFHKIFDRHHRGRMPQPRDPGYTVTNLVSDEAGVAPHTDAHLVNGWGISEGPTTPWWVSNAGTGTATLYDGLGTPQALVVNVPGGPTGQVYNPGSGFPVSNGTTDVPARFIFATLSGTIQGWPTPPPAATAATVKADLSASHAVFTGLAISPSGSTLYAADFANGMVDTWDSTWKPTTTPGAFSDPSLPKGYAPFGIQVLNGEVFVTYAKQPPTPGPELHGPGLGIVDEYTLAGALVHRVGSFGDLNAPWGLAWAPSGGFGRGSAALLVGNFGDGHITSFRQGPFGLWYDAGQLTGTDHRPLAIDGLWGMGFGNGSANQPTTSLFFAAGPDGGQHGLFGTVTANAPSGGSGGSGSGSGSPYPS
jgi:uncharacterized protein (TIGR03118 family)